MPWHVLLFFFFRKKRKTGTASVYSQDYLSSFQQCLSEFRERRKILLKEINDFQSVFDDRYSCNQNAHINTDFDLL